MSHGAKPFSSTYARESVQQVVDPSVVDLLADLVRTDRYVQIQFTYVPLVPGSLVGFVRGILVLHDDGRGKLWFRSTSLDKEAGDIDYRTGKATLRARYMVPLDDPVECRYSYDL